MSFPARRDVSWVWLIQSSNFDFKADSFYFVTLDLVKVEFITFDLVFFPSGTSEA